MVLDCVHIAKVKVSVGMVIVMRIVLSVMAICIASNATVKKDITRLFTDKMYSPFNILYGTSNGENTT